MLRVSSFVEDVTEDELLLRSVEAPPEVLLSLFFSEFFSKMDGMRRRVAALGDAGGDETTELKDCPLVSSSEKDSLPRGSDVKLKLRLETTDDRFEDENDDRGENAPA